MRRQFRSTVCGSALSLKSSPNFFRESNPTLFLNLDTWELEVGFTSPDRPVDSPVLGVCTLHVCFTVPFCRICDDFSLSRLTHPLCTHAHGEDCTLEQYPVHVT